MIIDEGSQIALVMFVGALAFAAVIGYCVKNNTSICEILGIKGSSQ
jgi:hypothetical protein